MKNQKDYKNNKGFTLVELIVVIVILAILAAILIPGLLKWIDQAKDKQYELEARSVYMATQALIAENYSGTITPGTKEIISVADDLNRLTELSGLPAVNTVYYIMDTKGTITEIEAWFTPSGRKPGITPPITMSWKTGGQWKKCVLDDYDTTN